MILELGRRTKRKVDKDDQWRRDEVDKTMSPVKKVEPHGIVVF